MAAQAQGSELVNVVVLLAAGVIAVPVFKRIGLGSVLGYLAAGLAIGPFGLGFFADPQAILHVAELGVVMFLFIIGLEMRPSHLWSLRREIFGLGTAQIALCSAAMTGVGLLFGFPPVVAFIGAMGFVLTSTAIVMQILGERGDLALPRGQRIVSILLFEDLLIVPLLALVALMAPPDANGATHSRWLDIGIAMASLATLLAAGIWLLNPLFRVLAAAKAREVMTAAALLVVLGAALLMQIGGLSMAMGAFLAGVLLSESTFRHQLEADVEPFRGILLGLFFLSVGMSLNLTVVAANWPLIVGGVLALMVVKAVCIYIVARLLKSCHTESLDRAVLMAQGGEFAFVLFSAAAAAKLIDAEINANLTAIVVLSMTLTPLAIIALRKLSPKIALSLEGVDEPNGLSGSVLLIGFGRFGQVVSQSLLARGVEVSIIDTDVEMIESAQTFGFKVYYGDGTRLDVLHASGAGSAQLIAICIDDRAAATVTAQLIKHEFPQARLLARSFDREHALDLVHAGVDLQVRETFESAMRFGEAALVELGVPVDEAAEVVADIRRRDAERFELELVGGVRAGTSLLYGNMQQTPLIAPKPRPSRRDHEEEHAPGISA
ncbi:proton antiporter-2 family protein [Lysobacter capsici]|uniref:Glutathione-regulated potassium-efflux system protein KefB n=1 Tax=Lysobacter capsici AZ78 TaxID=1444315 RepID=A0A125MMK0_9GAMM|nr:monovalent cation:proton antiporter-2 (CPA2) family protein [Lysobacter capsici]ALN85171.1 proton antiporter-2 family protein [Lysobacter capsici]KWS03653.1 Glutathione-regulated potassium-efflux system protein KefB [Lysobacter capsici AZ78]